MMTTASRKIDAADVAAPFRDTIRATIRERFGQQGPLLVGFLSNNDTAAVKYAEWTAKACEADGIRYELRKVPRDELEDRLAEANADGAVHGIMIYYPVFGAMPSFYGGTMDDYLRDSIAVEKDVEGLCHTYRYNLYHNKRFMDPPNNTIKCVLPCTPLAVVKLLEHLQLYRTNDGQLPLQGKVVVIFNRSDIVGRPLAAMLANDGADVYSVDISSMYLMRRGRLHETSETAESACRMADVIVTGVPSKAFSLSPAWVRPNTTIVNVSTFKNVDEAELLATVPGVVYVPLMGKVTVAMLERNLLRLYEHFGYNRR